jgi:hypothetical protein
VVVRVQQSAARNFGWRVHAGANCIARRPKHLRRFLAAASPRPHCSFAARESAFVGSRIHTYTRLSSRPAQDHHVSLGLDIRRRCYRLLCTSSHAMRTHARSHTDPSEQGRAALVALRRSGGGAGALGRSYYKGGFEPKMTRREAALILEMPYVSPTRPPLWPANDHQRTRHHQGTPAQEAPLAHAPQPPRSRRQPLPSHQSQRGQRVVGEGGQIGPDDEQSIDHLYYYIMASAWRWTGTN